MKIKVRKDPHNGLYDTDVTILNPYPHRDGSVVSVELSTFNHPTSHAAKKEMLEILHQLANHLLEICHENQSK